MPHVSIEVYVINLILGIVVFFILRWGLRKFIKAEKLRLRLTWIGTLLLTPILYVILVLFTFSMMFYEPPRNFDRARWRDDPHGRYQMRDDIIDSRILDGKNKTDIVELIGPPNFGADTCDTWEYDLGTSSKGFGWQFNTLIVTFENNRVVKVEKEEIVD